MRPESGFFTRQRTVRVLLLAFVAMFTTIPSSFADASTYGGPYFGDGNIPPGCERDMDPNDDRWWSAGPPGLLGGPDTGPSFAVCHHMRTDMNFLDSPQIDVLILAPLSEPERTIRLAQQSIDMWEGGIKMLSEDMGLDWLAEGLDFHIAVDRIDPAGDNGGEFTTYPIIDPEIVIVTGVNPVGSLGIGTTAPVRFTGCHGISNPFDLEAWEALPGYDSHHEDRGGIYTEDCDGGGGDICYAVNTTTDTSVVGGGFSMFDLISHEVGHCLSVGHVGDGAEGGWGGLPPDDIMAYDEGVDGAKCVSTLNVEGFALRMSNHLDVNGDGAVDASDVLVANNATGGGYKNDGDPFQVMHPDDYFYASSTGDPADCPQPDDGLLPGERVDWMPGAESKTAQLTVTSPADGTENQSGDFTVTGTVEHVEDEEEVPPSFVTVDDPAADGVSPTADLLELAVEVTDDHVLARQTVTQLDTNDDPQSIIYRFVVGDAWFDSQLLSDGSILTSHDQGTGNDDIITPAVTSSWDFDANTVTFSIERDYLTSVSETAPYDVAGWTYTGLLLVLRDDLAPDAGTVSVAAPVGGEGSMGIIAPPLPTYLSTTTFEHDGTLGNQFFTENSTLGTGRDRAFTSEFTGFGTDLSPMHHFSLDVTEPSDVTFQLEWVDATGLSDLDLFITGAADSGSTGATGTGTVLAETVTLEDVNGTLDIAVEPYLITDAVDGVTYTLTAQVTSTDDGTDTDEDGITDFNDQCPNDPGIAPTGCPDSDGDGVIDLEDDCPNDFTTDTTANGCPDRDGDGVGDDDDACPDVAGTSANGCPIVTIEEVNVYVDDVLVGTDEVDTSSGLDTFSVDLPTLDEGTHTVRVDWVEASALQASTTLTLAHDTDDDDDGVDNANDLCEGFDDSIDADEDGIPDDCDDRIVADTDGDGFLDDEDNCPAIANADQADADGDDAGDACDPDIDGDGVDNAVDACPGHDDNVDVDEDGIPDGCDDRIMADTDGDGFLDDEDNCVNDPNPNQTDHDNDGVGNACDPDVTGDHTAPTVTAELSRPANHNGWYGNRVRLNFTCSDAESGVAACPAPIWFDEEGADQGVSVVVFDIAGNATSLDVTGINIDLGAPTVSLNLLEGAPATAGQLGGPGSAGKYLSGTVTDGAAGASRVIVEWTSLDADITVVQTVLPDCTTATDCTWETKVPNGSRHWDVRARAVDLAGYWSDWTTSTHVKRVV